MVVGEVTKMMFEKDNKNVRGNLLSHMTNTLFNLFVTYKFPEEYGIV